MKIPHVALRPWKPLGAPSWQPPRPSPWFPNLVDLIGRLYVRWGLGLDRVVLRGAGTLADAVAGARSHGDRVILAFRHCGDADPQGLWYALHSLTKKEFRALVPGPRVRFLFLASAEIALWGGPLASWALRASGTLALAHGIGAKASLDYLRRHLRESADPIALAPEGQITYELEGEIHLDPGAANMALWAAEAAQGVARLVPVGVRYRCPRETWKRWDAFMRDLEAGIGLDPWAHASVEGTAAQRLGRAWDQLLTLGEGYYRKNHHRELSPLASRAERCQRLARTAVELAAAVRGVPTGPSLRPTIFHLRASALGLVFPRPRNSSTLGRALEVRTTAEGWWINRHQDLADILQCLNPEALTDHPSLERSIEAALNLADVAGRLAGGHIDHRPRYFRRVLEITVGDPWVVEKFEGRSHRARAAEITAKIKTEFERLAREEN